MSKSQRILCVLILQDRWWVVHTPFVHMVKFKFLAQLPVVSRLILFWDTLWHSLIMSLIVLSLSSHTLHLVFCCALSIFAFIWLVLMALFCAAFRRDSVSLSSFIIIIIIIVVVGGGVVVVAVVVVVLFLLFCWEYFSKIAKPNYFWCLFAILLVPIRGMCSILGYFLYSPLLRRSVGTHFFTWLHLPFRSSLFFSFRCLL